MRIALLMFAVGCAGSTASPAGGGVEPPAPGDGGDDGDSGGEGAGDSGGDGAGVDTAAPGGDCPPQMVAVPADDPLFCLDTYEGSEDGDAAASVAGVTPLVGMSFNAARERCAATPVLDESGAVVGHKRLARLDEWRDAADGVLGPGGSTYPTGEAWPGATCAVPDESGAPIYERIQPTGSLPGCVGPFGAFDQLGNAWEWADPGLTLDQDAFLAARAAEGLALTVEGGGALRVAAGEASGLRLEIAGLVGEVSVSDGVVVAADVFFQAEEPFAYRGYLVAEAASPEASADWMLPVEVLREDGVIDDPEAPLVVRTSEDGAPVTAKVGCAWYTGGPGGCRNIDAFFGHPHDFDGTIGLRCAADPL